ncbi:MAG: hypothetical protein KTR15_02390 [Phycisphaeraceae bacterium]|nr:hypothetical protein [Phycisphaeraceae bacterium]
MPHEDEQFDTLPPAIIDALRDIDGPAVLPDAQRDADVLSGARQHLAQAAPVDRKRRNLRLFFAGGAGGAIAAAAMVAFVVFVGNPFAKQADPNLAAVTPNSPQPTLAQPGDLDANGSIDILDAYALAKQIDRGQASTETDLNGDGRIDQSDIDWIANRSVALNTGEQG